MVLLPANDGARRRGTEFPSGDQTDRLAEFLAAAPASARWSKRSRNAKIDWNEDVDQPIAAMDLSRISLDNNGRLFWDGKPVVVRRRLALSGWQKFAAWVITLAIIVIALSASVFAAIGAHNWMCGAKWTSSYCPAPPPAPAPRPAPNTDLPN